MALKRQEIREIVDALVSEVRGLLLTKKEMIGFEERILARLDSLDKHLVEIREEIRISRKMYQFWADRHLSPDLMDEYLKTKASVLSTKPKRVD